MAERLLAWRSARWRRRKANWSGECVGQARGRVNVTAGRARASAARGSALKRLATRGVHAAVEF